MLKEVKIVSLPPDIDYDDIEAVQEFGRQWELENLDVANDTDIAVIISHLPIMSQFEIDPWGIPTLSLRLRYDASSDINWGAALESLAFIAHTLEEHYAQDELEVDALVVAYTAKVMHWWDKKTEKLPETGTSI